MNSTIIISDLDMRRLRPLIEARVGTRGPDADNLARLAHELDRAEVVPAADVPGDVIAMDSVVELENLASGERLTFTLAFPEWADADHDRISVLAPLGSAMLGYREGDWFEWPTPGGTVRMAVRRVVSPRQAPACAAR
ncbi:MAG TPA: GreA/GreB family elongation factor [Verrucomicrobiae bacterium]|nr:GreA/GreB family elongation factor [Verrucomicrobiae bacterium]